MIWKSKVVEGSFFILECIMIAMYIFLFYLYYKLNILNEITFEYEHYHMIKLAFPIVCFLIGVFAYLMLDARLNSKKSKVVSVILFVLVILETLMIEVVYGGLMPANPFLVVVQNMDIRIYDIIFSYNYLDGFNIIIGFVAASFFKNSKG